MKQLILVTMMLAILCMPASAALVVDQLNLPIADPDNSSPLSGLYQSFKQTNGNITGAGLRVAYQDPNSDSYLMKIALWDKPEYDGGTELISGSVVVAASGLFDVFWSPYSITPGTEYFLKFSLLNVPGPMLTVLADAYAFDTYPDGKAIGASLAGVPYPDLAFRTWYDSGGGTTPVPEPVTILLLGSGLASLAAMRRMK